MDLNVVMMAEGFMSFHSDPDQFSGESRRIKAESGLMQVGGRKSADVVLAR